MENNEILNILDRLNKQTVFDEDTHTYKCDGKSMISVSVHIKPWNRSFNNMMDPQHKEYNKFLAKSMPFFQNRGTRVHKFSEGVDEGFMGAWHNDLKKYEMYYKQFHHMWIKSGKWEVVAIEARIFSKWHNVAGTVDRIYRDTKTKELILMDVKSGATQPINFYQQAMYCQILRENGIMISKSYLLSLKNGAELKLIEGKIITEKINEMNEYYEGMGTCEDCGKLSYLIQSHYNGKEDTCPQCVSEM